MKNSILKKGTFFVLTTGEYSDYEMITLCIATTDIDVIALRSEYLEINPEQDEAFSFETGDFVKWLIVDKKVCQELDYFEWHVDRYHSVFSVDSYGGDYG